MTAGIDWDAAAAAHPGLTEWLATFFGRAYSADSLAFHCVGAPHHVAWPFDARDFIRCEELLRRVPTLRPIAYRVMPQTGPVWAALIAEWGDLVDLWEQSLAEPDDAVSEHPLTALNARIYYLLSHANQVNNPEPEKETP